MREPLVSALVKGFASHHAGLLPGWKGIVESLFQQGKASDYHKVGRAACETSQRGTPLQCKKVRRAYIHEYPALQVKQILEKVLECMHACIEKEVLSGLAQGF